MPSNEVKIRIRMRVSAAPKPVAVSWGIPSEALVRVAAIAGAGLLVLVLAVALISAIAKSGEQGSSGFVQQIPNSSPRPIQTQVPSTPEPTPATLRISYGQTVEGTIAETREKDLWQFTAKAGDVVTVTMSSAGSNTLSPVVSVLDTRGHQIVMDNWAACGLAGNQATVHNLKIEVSGTYTIVAGSSCPSGDYTLMLESTPARMILYSQTVRGVIRDPGWKDLWQFTAKAGDVVTVTMSSAGSNTLSPVVSVLDTRGHQIVMDNWAACGLAGNQATVHNLKIEVSGTYTIVAGSSCPSGDYTLMLSKQ